MDTSLASATLRPPVLDGKNYSLWKVKIRYYIKLINERAWQCVINGWNSPVMIDQEGDSLPKPETDWTVDEVQNSNYNSKALNAIFTSVDMNMFSLITNCTSAKSACGTLQRHCEGFNIKFCAIDEAKDTSQMAFEDLISSLRAFEVNMDMQKKDKGKTIAFQASNDSYNELLQISQEVNDSDLCEDSISFITKNSCRECQGFGHYANECANRFRKNKGYNVSLSDEESDLEEKYTDEDNQISLTALLTENHRLHVNSLGVGLGVATPSRNICKNSVCLKFTTSGNSTADEELESGDEEMTLESVQKFYEELFEDWTKRNKLNSTLVKENIDLKVVVAKLELILCKKDVELGKTKDELQKATENLSKFYSSTSKLETILSMGRDDKKDLRFKDSVYETGESSKSTVLVIGTLIVTGSREHLIDYVEQNCSRVTYGGGAKGKIVGNGTLNVEGLPKLHNVFHVEGLNSRLISISQLCDDNLLVKFDKHTCEVFDETNMCIMTGTRSSDNCYIKYVKNFHASICKSPNLTFGIKNSDMQISKP
ncbi:uncharacterized protein [Primulina eburnea]|uniref:uncharacterized protein n=1 Tax=Primulina eburnea TaxID=1245227 RepID=UPI003C6CAE00